MVIQGFVFVAYFFSIYFLYFLLLFVFRVVCGGGGVYTTSAGGGMGARMMLWYSSSRADASSCCRVSYLSGQVFSEGADGEWTVGLRVKINLLQEHPHISYRFPGFRVKN